MFAVLQSALTGAIAAAIASVSQISQDTFFRHWLESWLLAWIDAASRPFLLRLEWGIKFRRCVMQEAPGTSAVEGYAFGPFRLFPVRCLLLGPKSLFGGWEY
jgi:hypothetical protein